MPEQYEVSRICTNKVLLALLLDRDTIPVPDKLTIGEALVYWTYMRLSNHLERDSCLMAIWHLRKQLISLGNAYSLIKDKSDIRLPFMLAIMDSRYIGIAPCSDGWFDLTLLQVKKQPQHTLEGYTLNLVQLMYNQMRVCGLDRLDFEEEQQRMKEEQDYVSQT